MKEKTPFFAQLIQQSENTSVTTEQLFHIYRPELEDNSSEVTKEIIEILKPLQKNDKPQFIKMEGAPDIGKSVLK